MKNTALKKTTFKINPKDLYKRLQVISSVIKAARRVSPRYFYINIFAMLVTALLPILSGLLLAAFIEEFSRYGSPELANKNTILIIIGGYVLSVLLLDIFDEIFASINYLLLRYDISAHFIDTVVKKVNELDIEFFENPEFENMKSRALDTFEWRPAQLTRMTFDTGQKILRAVFNGAALVFTIPNYTLLLMLSIIPSLIVDYKYQGGAWDIWSADTKTRRSYGYLLYVSSDNEAKYVKELRLLGISKYFRDLLNSLVRKVYDHQKQVQYQRMWARLGMNLLPVGVIAFILISVSNNLFSGLISLGTFTFIIYNIFSFKNNFAFAMFDLGGLLSESNYVVDIFDMLKIKGKIKSPRNAVKEIKSPPVIEFDNVSFRYPGTERYILKDFNLKLKAGEKVAIVGENGAGKSTIIKLILRFYDVTSGMILINGIDIKKLDLTEWRNMIAALLQDFQLFNMITIADNIGMGNINKYQEQQLSGKRTPTEIIAAAKRSAAHEFISSEKKQYREVVGRSFSGVNFSGGENQRLALARTFYRDAGLVIMDEPTSNVDANAEIEIFAAIKKHLENKTVIFVSHRFSTVRIADRIIVVNNGEIIEQGSHRELLDLSGMYAKLFKAQADSYS